MADNTEQQVETPAVEAAETATSSSETTAPPVAPSSSEGAELLTDEAPPVQAEENAEPVGLSGAETATPQAPEAESAPPAEAVETPSVEEGAEAPAAAAPESQESPAPQPKKARRRGPSPKNLEKLATLQPGAVLTGTVRSIQTYGAFVDIGVGTDGLVHISELKDGFVEKVEDVVKPGDTVEVRIKEVDQERGRISLTMRSEQKPEKKEPKAKRLRLKDLSEGQEFTGTVTSIVDFGAFVDIGATTDGLVHISELSDERVNKVSDVLEVGQEVTVRVLQVDRKRNRISLTMRERIEPEVIEEEDSDDEPLPSVMELAFARAAERQQKDKARRRRGKGTQSELDDIIRRTLDQHRG